MNMTTVVPFDWFRGTELEHTN